jgi:hypothetical protein
MFSSEPAVAMDWRQARVEHGTARAVHKIAQATPFLAWAQRASSGLSRNNDCPYRDSPLILLSHPHPRRAMSHLYVPVIDDPAPEQSTADNQVIVQGKRRRRFVPSVAAPPRGQRSLQVGEHELTFQVTSPENVLLQQDGTTTYRVEPSFQMKGRTIDNVQNCGSYINIPYSINRLRSSGADGRASPVGSA